MAAAHDPQKSFHPHLIPAMILCVATVSLIFGVVSVILYRQIDGAAKTFSLAMARMDNLFKDSGATATNVQFLRDDFRSMHQELIAVRKDFRDDLKGIRDDSSSILDEIKRLRDIQATRDVTWHEIKNEVSKLTISSNDVRHDISELRGELKSTKSYEIQVIESYGIKVDEQLVVKLHDGVVSVSPLTAQKTQQIQNANFVQLTFGASDRTWWIPPPPPPEYTATIRRATNHQRSKPLNPRP